VTITFEELARRLGDPGLVVLDVRTPAEYEGATGYPCDPMQGHIPGARNLDLMEILDQSSEQIRLLVELPEGAEIVCYCHSGQRSAMAAEALRTAGYKARNYEGSWHEWSRSPLAGAPPGRRSRPPNRHGEG
jgi:thiosulfate/3-mercaptopyruvate sulfurtransferase